MKRWPWLLVLAALVALAALAIPTFQEDREPSKSQRPFADSVPVVGGARMRAEDRSAQSDLRNAMTAEKTVYTDTQAYTDDVSELGYVEASLDWGGTLHVFVGDVSAADDDDGVVCLDETSASGMTFSIGDVASGPLAGTYFGNMACPAEATSESVSNIGTSWP